jgi:hypothetical protein
MTQSGQRDVRSHHSQSSVDDNFAFFRGKLVRDGNYLQTHCVVLIWSRRRSKPVSWNPPCHSKSGSHNPTMGEALLRRISVGQVRCRAQRRLAAHNAPITPRAKVT